MAQVITDKAGRTWSLDLTIGTALRIDELTGFGLLDDSSFLDQKPTGMAAALAELERSPTKLAKVLWAACRPEIEARRLEADGFYLGFDGPTLKKAFPILVEAICDFFPDRAADIRRMAERMINAQIKGNKLRETQAVTEAKFLDSSSKVLEKKLGELDIEAMVEEMLAKGLKDLSLPGSTSGNLPVILASTPDRSPGEN